MKRIIFSFVVVAAIAVSAVVVTSCGNANAQGGGSAKSERWEYTDVYYYDKDAFNQLGKQGWELVTYGGCMNSCHGFVFKRRL